MYISLAAGNEELVKKAWDVLKEKGKVYMDLQETFFARRHGSLRDQFGINWMFTVSKQANT